MSYPMPTDPEVLAFIERTERFYPSESNGLTPDDNRRLYNELCAAFHSGRPAGVSTVDETIAADHPARAIPIRRYTKAGARPEGIMLYLHGGGFVVGSLDSHDDTCAEICNRTGLEVIAVDYRLAPEFVHPAALDDVEIVYRTLVPENVPIVVGGDSAGGNLTAALCLRARSRGFPMPAGQVHLYPGLGGDHDQGSYLEMADAPMLKRDDIIYYFGIYSGGLERGQHGDPELSPLLATDFRGLAPAAIITADIDPVRDDGRHYAERLKADGVPVFYRNEPELVHSYLRARNMSARAETSIDLFCAHILRLVRNSGARLARNAAE